MSNLEVLQDAMRTEGLDVLLLGSEPPGQFAVGHRRIGVQMPGSPIPLTVVPSTGAPHVVTADPDGATHLPPDHVHGLMWNPATLVTELPRWLGRSGAIRAGVDTLGPGGMQLVHAALPDCELVDATALLARVMMPKDDDETQQLKEVCDLLHDAATAGLDGGPAALVSRMQGAFPVYPPRLSSRSVAVAARHGGFVGEARLGPGDPEVGSEAVAALVAGNTVDVLARRLPPGVSVIGLGRGFEAPLLSAGVGTPPGVELSPGTVVGVRWQSCAVTVQIGETTHRYLSPTPQQVTR